MNRTSISGVPSSLKARSSTLQSGIARWRPDPQASTFRHQSRRILPALRTSREVSGMPRRFAVRVVIAQLRTTLMPAMMDEQRTPCRAQRELHRGPRGSLRRGAVSMRAARVSDGSRFRETSAEPPAARALSCRGRRATRSEVAPDNSRVSTSVAVAAVGSDSPAIGGRPWIFPLGDDLMGASGDQEGII
jgi:hypothetical protein